MKLKYLISCILIQYSAILMSFEVRVIPVTKDYRTGQWTGLFGRDVAGNWAEFKTKSDGNSSNPSYWAGKALYDQTLGFLNIPSATLQAAQTHIVLPNGDWLYFAPIDYISPALLHKKLHDSKEANMYKDKFVWIPLDDLLSHSTIIRTARAKVMRFSFNRDLTLLLRDYYQKMVPILNAYANNNPFKSRL